MAYGVCLLYAHMKMFHAMFMLAAPRALCRTRKMREAMQLACIWWHYNFESSGTRAAAGRLQSTVAASWRAFVSINSVNSKREGMSLANY